MDILKKMRSINVDYHQVGWYQSTYLNSHITKDFLESHVRYQQAIEESTVLVYGELSFTSPFCVLILFSSVGNDVLIVLYILLQLYVSHIHYHLDHQVLVCGSR